MSSFNSPNRSAALRDPSSDLRPDFSSAFYANVVAAAAYDSGRTQDEVVAELNAAWEFERAQAWEAHLQDISEAQSALLSTPPNIDDIGPETDPQPNQPDEPALPWTVPGCVHIPHPETYRGVTQWFGWRVTDDDLVRYAQPQYDGDLRALSGYERAHRAVELWVRNSAIRRLRLELAYTPKTATEPPSLPYMVLTFFGYNMQDMETDLRFRPWKTMVEPINAFIGRGPQWFLASAPADVVTSVASLNKPLSSAANAVNNAPQTHELVVPDPNSRVHIPHPKTHRSDTGWYGWRVTDDDLVRYAQPLYAGDLLALGGYERVRVAVQIMVRDSAIHRLRVELGYTPPRLILPPCTPYSVLTFCGSSMKTDRQWRPSNAQVERISAWIGCRPRWFLAFK